MDIPCHNKPCYFCVVALMTSLRRYVPAQQIGPKMTSTSSVSSILSVPNVPFLGAQKSTTDRSKDDVNFFSEQHPQRSKRAVPRSTEVDEIDVTVNDASTHSTSTKHNFLLDTNSSKNRSAWIPAVTVRQRCYLCFSSPNAVYSALKLRHE